MLIGIEVCGVLRSAHSMPTCLNCGAALQGPFCRECGQRVIPPYPTLREMATDAWHEFSGWGGRFVRTFRTLLRPGALTIDGMEGCRVVYPSRWPVVVAKIACLFALYALAYMSTLYAALIWTALV